MAAILAERRARSTERLSRFPEKLTAATAICTGKACVYVTGSFGRGEGGTHSDLDAFILGRRNPTDETRELSKLDEICLKRELIVASRELEFPDFSGDGEYLTHYTVDELVKTTGQPEDDVNNTFTARLLLLLESRPLIGDEKVLLERIGDRATRIAYFDQANAFGDAVFDLIEKIGHRSRLHRLLVVYMEFRIADTFTDSLSRLTGDEQKAVKTTAFDLQLNPSHPGLQLHKLDKPRDPNFLSVRVNRDVRLIVHKTADSLLLCYVDHHDKAYEWAERRKLETPSENRRCATG